MNQRTIPRLLRMTGLALIATISVSNAPAGELDAFLSGIRTLEQQGQADRIVRNLQHVVAGNGYLSVDMISDDVAALEASLAALGAENIASYGNKVGALVPVAAIEQLEQAPGMMFARPAFALANANRVRNNGRAVSEGDRSMRTDDVRALYGVSGAGLSVGVLSDSFACNPGPFGDGESSTTAAQDIGRDLPPFSKLEILQDLTGLKVSSVPQGCGSDEGRAMMQLIHDVAPLAAQKFHSAFISEADFALGIIELAAAGSDVIVDDIIYFAEPMFQNGVVAQAANAVNAAGVPYFSSAGNRDRDSYEAEFRPVEVGDLTVHDFDPGPGVDTMRSLQVTAEGFTVLSFQWDEPFFSASGLVGSASDLDVFWYYADGSPIADCTDPSVGPTDTCQFTGDPNVGGDAVDLAALYTEDDVGEVFQIQFIVRDGPAPNIVKYVDFDGTVPLEWQDDDGPTTYGHNNAEGANAIAAAFALFTEEFPGFQQAFGVDDLCDPACVNGFSSVGGVPLLFNDDGSRKTTPVIGEKPVVTGPDGTDTSFFVVDSIDGDGLPNFFGTSAAAPHVAALAVLMLEGAGGSGSLAPALVTELLSVTAQDVTEKAFFGAFRSLPAGFDNDSGYGFVDGMAVFDEMLDRGLLD